MELADDEDDDTSEGESFGSMSQAHPLDGLSDAALRATYQHHPETLGSVSVGSPNAGQLINGVRPPQSSLYHLVDPDHAWGTQETVDALCYALNRVAEQHPGTPSLDIGHLSAKHGGPLQPHRSHQSGRDVDVGLYYLQQNTRWYTRAASDTLDLARTWALIRTLAVSSDIEMILLDSSLQKPVEAHALSVESNSAWVHLLFHGDGTKPALVRHSPGHATHLHLRFRNPVARRSAQRLAPLLGELRPRQNQTVLRQTQVVTRSHVAKAGDTLAKLAQHYCTSMDAIRAANRMKGYQLQAGQTYLIPIEKTATDRTANCGKPR
jgi:penicillin-insensitive murein endopeptidase